MPLRVIFRAAMVALAWAACSWLTRRAGPWTALAIWSGAMAVICALVALLLRLQPVGRVGPANYAAGLVLPYGFRIGNGRLWPAVVTSAIVWALLGAAVIVVSSDRVAVASNPADASHPFLRTCLLISWVIDGAALLYVLSTMLAEL